MLARLIDLSVRFRWIVALLAVALLAYGGSQLAGLPIDAVPDITNRQVQINTIAPALGPEEVERQVTFPVETALAGIGPGRDPLAVAARFLADHRRLHRRHRPLLRPQSDQRAAAGRSRRPARRA